MIAYESAVKTFQDNNDEETISNYSHGRKLSRRKLSIDRCEHCVLTRVYEYAGILIKLNIESTRPCYIDYIDLNRKESLDYIRLKENKYIRSMYEY